MKKVCILGIEPIHPATGGSRIRLKGLYNNLGNDFDVRYVGAFHWRGESLRRIPLGDRFYEITVPLSDAHFLALEELGQQVHGTSLIDESFPRLGHLSGQLLFHATKILKQADIAIFAHPWVYAIAKGAVDFHTQLLVYDAHNMEGHLRKMLLGDSQLEKELCSEVESLERDLCVNADIVITCSDKDRMQFIHQYEIDPEKFHVCPNGVFSDVIFPVAEVQKKEQKQEIQQTKQPFAETKFTAFFIGGSYKPNIEAVEFICNTLAPACPEISFVICGAAGSDYIKKHQRKMTPANVQILGSVDENEKVRLLQNSDIGINPMFSGSGTNVKMFDYLAAGLPVVTTPFGARGITSNADNNNAFITINADGFANQIKMLASNDALSRKLSKRGRSLVEDHYDWSVISSQLGALLRKILDTKDAEVNNGETEDPLFSVTIPSINRENKLRRLMDLLVLQSEKNFEVIIVDQSEKPFDPSKFENTLDIRVIHSSVKGACHARNLAASKARGRYLVFTDDDCEPCENWLAEAKLILSSDNVVGLTGRVFSDRLQDPDWRSVDNYGSESLGFMSCNLFATAKAFREINGFDTQFDEHDFRYDTEFGWRLESLGDVPFSEHAFIYHPPWPRSIARESEEIRNHMFVGDALLMKKHPQRYKEIFVAEEHWMKPGFWPPFLRGLKQYGVEMPDYVREKYEKQHKT